VQSINGNFGDLEPKHMALRQADCNLLFSVVTGQQATQCVAFCNPCIESRAQLSVGSNPE
jgi:hypothetical protein